MQIYRLIKAGRVTLGTKACCRWAKLARKRTWAGVNVRKMGSVIYRLGCVKGGTDRASRSRIGLPHLNSRVIRDYERSQALDFNKSAELRTAAAKLSEMSAWIGAQPPIHAQMHAAYAKMRVTNAEALMKTVRKPEDLAGMLDDQPPLSLLDPNIKAMSKRLTEAGADEAIGIRASSKRVSFSQIQQLAIFLAHSAGRPTTYKMLSRAMGVDASTLYRWRRHGHLRRFSRELRLDGFAGLAD